MFRDEAEANAQCSIVKSIVASGLVESFFSRFFPPSALSAASSTNLASYICVHFSFLLF
jgi:hypothetical protein